MSNRIQSQSENQNTALLVAQRSGAHHFEGVVHALTDHGWSVKEETLQRYAPIYVPRQLAAQADVIIHADPIRANMKSVIDAARSESIPVVLQMDGVLEYANTFLNPRAGRGVFMPAPADVVLASGPHDRAILNALGNRALATGLPRLHKFSDRLESFETEHEPSGLLVATANQPSHTPGGLARLMESLRHIKVESDRQAIAVRWRVSADIAQYLGVAQDRDDLVVSLSNVKAVMTSASTIAVESMLASKPTAIIHPHPWPLWIPCAWMYQEDLAHGIQEDRAAMDALMGSDIDANRVANESISSIADGCVQHRTSVVGDLIDSVLAPDAQLLSMQQRVVCQCTRKDSPARVARVIEYISRLGTSSSDEPSQEQASNLNFDENSEAVVDAFERIRNQGADRIAVAVGTKPTAAMEWLASNRSDVLAGFVVTGEPSGGVILGVKTVGHLDVQTAFQPDALLVTNPDDDPSIVAAMRLFDDSKVRLEKCYLPCDRVNHIEHVVDIAEQQIKLGEVRTSVERGVIEGARSVSIGEIFDGDRPCMILLEGNDADFEIFKRSQAWRSAGTVVHSLRWSTAELSSPERFAKIVIDLQGESYAVYGGGLHTERMMKHSGVSHQPSCILDDSAVRGKTIEGIPVIQPAGMNQCVSAIVISSLIHEAVLWDRTEDFRKRGGAVYSLYQGCEGLEGFSRHTQVNI